MSVIRGILIKQFGGPEVLEHLTTVPMCPKPTGKQLVVRVKAAGVNPVDTYIRNGTHEVKPELPYTPGMDGAGIVEEVGEQVTNYKAGDRVYWVRCIGGSYKEMTLTEEHATFSLNPQLSFQQGAALGVPYFTAYRALVSKAKLLRGETVLIHGASGATGLACCQIARHLGATVIGTAGTDDGLKTVLENGAHTALNHRQPGYTDKLKADGGVDVVVEMLANVNLEADLDLCRLNSRIAIVGSRGKIEISPRFAMKNEVSIFGVMLNKATEAEWTEMGAFMAAGQADGWLRPVIGLEFPLEKASDAHAEVIAHSVATKGKIVLTMM